MNLAIDEVRAGEARRMVQDGYELVREKSRWCLLKRPENLTDKQRIKLRDVLCFLEVPWTRFSGTVLMFQPRREPTK